ncbi:MAG TPA: LiaF domain-containing protein [Gaiellaceae bacterium]|nr:LiaF domain-containing protein [Gaiellaceae bacterium]
MRVLKSFGLVLLGAFAGFAGAAAVARRLVPSRGDAESDEVALVAIFDGIDLKSTAQAFRGGSILAWFGGIAVDLREAQLAPGAHLSVHSLFGGIALRVPAGWKVESNANAIVGGVAVQHPPVDTEDPPTLTLDGFTVFGGIAVGARQAGEDTGVAG